MKTIVYNGSSKIIKRIVHLLNRKAPLPLDGQGDADWGTNGQVLTTDGNGNTSWTTPQGGGGDVTDVEVNGTSVVNAQGVAEVSVPTKTSDLTNDSGFITNLVNDLANYYTKSQTYTQAEVDALISGIVTLNILVVQALPTQDISTTTIYLVPKQDTGTSDIYDEYLYINNVWELIGTTQIDLSNYVTTTDLSTALADYVTSVGLATILADYVQSSDLATVATSGSYNDLSNKPTIPTAASDITYDNTASGLSATDAQGAIDEVNTETVNNRNAFRTGLLLSKSAVDNFIQEVCDFTYNAIYRSAIIHNESKDDVFTALSNCPAGQLMIYEQNSIWADHPCFTFIDIYNNILVGILEKQNNEWGIYGYQKLARSTTDNNFTANQTIDRKDGTVSAIGYSSFVVGNTTPQGTSGNSEGQILLCGKGSYYSVLQATNMTAHRTHELPDKSGTIALTTDLPDMTNVAYKNVNNQFSTHQSIHGSVSVDQQNGTTTTVGESYLVVGNNKAQGTDGNSVAVMRLYGSGSSYADLQARNVTANRNIQMPDKSGTIALLEDFKPSAGTTAGLTSSYGTIITGYVRIGNLVILNMRFVAGSSNIPAGALFVNGLPAATEGGLNHVACVTNSTVPVQINGSALQNQATIPAGTTIFVSATYFTGM